MRIILVTAVLVLLAATATAKAPNRGLAAMETEQGVYLSWRLLNTDESNVGFDVFRIVNNKPVKLNATALVAGTNFLDKGATLVSGNDYFVVSAEGVVSELAIKTNEAYFNVQHDQMTHARTMALGDLNKDGSMEYIGKFPATNIDPARSMWKESTGKYWLTAFTQDGKIMWKYDMGWAIETGIWYSPYVVYDLDKDGKSELIVKAGDESMGKDAMRDSTGRVVYGPEYVRVIDGYNGSTVLAQADWPDRTGFSGDALESYNRASRNFIAIAYLDGVNPHVIVSRGTYGRHKVAAYLYDKATGLTPVWHWENKNYVTEGGVQAHWGQGAHSLQAHDVDGDGKDEVVLGGLVLNSDGTVRYSLNRGHVDHIYVADMTPANPGKEIYWGSEAAHRTHGIGMADASTGKWLWGVPWATTHIHREGMCADVSGNTGIECFSGEYNLSKAWTFSSAGAVLREETNVRPQDLIGQALYWGGDFQKEMLYDSETRTDAVLKYITRFSDNKVPLGSLDLPWDIRSGNHGDFREIAIVDVLGDWREEVIAVDRNRIVIYMSTIPTQERRVWLMQDRTYGLGFVNSSVGYYQQPMLGFDINQPLTPPAECILYE